MSELLLFLLGPSTSDPIVWAALREDRLFASGRLANSDELSSVTTHAREARFVAALLPGEEIAARPMPAAPRGAGKRKAAATLLLEDDLAESPATLAIAVIGEAGRAVALAAKASIVTAWKEDFAAAGIELDCLSADYLALRTGAGEAIVILHDGRAIVSVGGAGCAVERDLFFALSQQLLKDATQIEYIGPGLERASIPGAAAVARRSGLSEEQYLELMARSVAAAQPPSLLERPLIRKGAVAAALAPWRRAAMLAAGLLAVVFVGTLAEGARAQWLAAHWNRAATALHQERHPGAAASDPVAYARTVLAQGGARGSFMTLNQKIADALEDNPSVDIDRIRYNAERGELVATVRSTSDSAIEAFKAALAAGGVAAADAGGYRRVGEHWTGELTARLR